MVAKLDKLAAVIPPHGSIVWISFSMIMLFFSFGHVKETNNSLVVTKGTLTSYSFGRGGDFSLMLRLEGRESEKLFFSGYRSSLSGGIEERVGKEFTIEHYGRFVANCWDAGKQFCFSKCQTDAQCSRDQGASETWILQMLALCGFVSYAAVFIWAVFVRR